MRTLTSSSSYGWRREGNWALLVAVGAAVAWSTSVPAQAPVGDASVSGHVIDARTGRPVAGATVLIQSLEDAPNVDGRFFEWPLDSASAQKRGASPPQETKTAPDGAFVFRGLLPGKHWISAQAKGYVLTSVDRRPIPRGTNRALPNVVVQAGQQLSAVVVLAWKGATLSGHVVDDGGDPAADVAVALLHERTLGSRRRLELVARTETDDQGTYRFTELRAGRYVVAVPSTVITVPKALVEDVGIAGDARNAALTNARSSGAPIPYQACVPSPNMHIARLRDDGFAPR